MDITAVLCWHELCLWAKLILGFSVRTANISLITGRWNKINPDSVRQIFLYPKADEIKGRSSKLKHRKYCWEFQYFSIIICNFSFFLLSPLTFCPMSRIRQVFYVSDSGDCPKLSRMAHLQWLMITQLVCLLTGRQLMQRLELDNRVNEGPASLGPLSLPLALNHLNISTVMWEMSFSYLFILFVILPPTHRRKFRKQQP